MATVASTLVDQVPILGTTKHYAAVTVTQPDKINSINDFILHQARALPDTPLLAYPRSELGAADFADYTSKQLDTYADEASKHLSSLGLRPFVSVSPHISDSADDY